MFAVAVQRSYSINQLFSIKQVILGLSMQPSLATHPRLGFEEEPSLKVVTHRIPIQQFLDFSLMDPSSRL